MPQKDYVNCLAEEIFLAVDYETHAGRVRAVAAEEDRPVSEIIPRAVEKFLEMKSNSPAQNGKLPTFRGGEILVSAENLKEEIYSDEPV